VKKEKKILPRKREGKKLQRFSVKRRRPEKDTWSPIPRRKSQANLKKEKRGGNKHEVWGPETGEKAPADDCSQGNTSTPCSPRYGKKNTDRLHPGHSGQGKKKEKGKSGTGKNVLLRKTPSKKVLKIRSSIIPCFA